MLPDASDRDVVKDFCARAKALARVLSYLHRHQMPITPVMLGALSAAANHLAEWAAELEERAA